MKKYTEFGNMSIKTGSGKTILLGELLGKGTEGAVYSIKNDNSIVAKIEGVIEEFTHLLYSGFFEVSYE